MRSLRTFGWLVLVLFAAYGVGSFVEAHEREPTRPPRWERDLRDVSAFVNKGVMDLGEGLASALSDHSDRLERLDARLARIEQLLTSATVCLPPPYDPPLDPATRAGGR